MIDNPFRASTISSRPDSFVFHIRKSQEKVWIPAHEKGHLSYLDQQILSFSRQLIHCDEPLPCIKQEEEDFAQRLIKLGFPVEQPYLENLLGKINDLKKRLEVEERPDQSYPIVFDVYTPFSHSFPDYFFKLLIFKSPQQKKKEFFLLNNCREAPIKCLGSIRNYVKEGWSLESPQKIHYFMAPLTKEKVTNAYYLRLLNLSEKTSRIYKAICFEEDKKKTYSQLVIMDLLRSKNLSDRLREHCNVYGAEISLKERLKLALEAALII